jgi:hypothetical protein
MNQVRSRDRNSTSIKPISLTGASQELWEGNPRRRAAILFLLPGYQLTIGYTNPMTITSGLVMSNSNYPYIFDADRFGDLCCHQVFGISSVAGNAGLLEVFDDEANIDLSRVDAMEDVNIGYTYENWPSADISGARFRVGMPPSPKPRA